MTKAAKVLILSSLDDPHAHAVLTSLQELGAEVDFFRYEEFVQKSQFVYRFGAVESTAKVTRDGAALDLRSYGAIWHRRPGPFIAGGFPESWIDRMVENEAKAAFDGFIDLAQTLWVNHPTNDELCAKKLVQLHFARAVGMKVPETLVTNQPELVREFFRECGGFVIYKLISERSNFLVPLVERPAGISTQPMTENDLAHLEQVNLSPNLFQQQIRKVADLRITIVGHDLFAVKIYSQEGAGKIDWRHDYSVKMEPYVLPKDIENQCFELARTLKLNYGAIDMVLDENQEYVFLEINSAGQYLWLEDKANLPISDSIAKLLVGLNKPLISGS